MTTTDIRTDVPMDIHPGTLLEHHDTLNIDGTMGPSVLRDGHGALSTIYETIGKLRDAEEAWEATAPKTTRMVGGSVTQVSLPSDDLITAAQRAFTSSAKIVDVQTQALGRHVNALETLVEAAVTGEKTPLAAEIRGHVKSLKTGEDRLAFVQSLVFGKKRQDVAAILAAPPYLSGLTDAQHSVLRESAADTFATTQHRQLRAAREVLSQVERASGTMLAAFTKVLSKKDSPAAKASAAFKALG